MNEAFKKMFLTSNSLIKKPISTLFDPEGFHILASGEEEIYEETVKHEKYDIVCHQIYYKLKEEKQYVGVFVNVTKNVTTESKLDDIRNTTMIQAKELLQHQMKMSQELAKLLGENAAQSEVMINNIIKYTEARYSQNVESTNTNLLWDTNTSK